MQNGWGETWPEGRQKITSIKQFVKVDEKLYKEMKKKAAGHHLIF